MAGNGPPPKPERDSRSNTLIRGEWISLQAVGWQLDEPDPPEGLMLASMVAWATWFASWFAAHWDESDLPGLRQVIRLYDQVERGEFARHGELRLAMDGYGITPKGQQDRRWAPPRATNQPSGTAAAPQPAAAKKKQATRKRTALLILEGGKGTKDAPPA